MIRIEILLGLLIICLFEGKAQNLEWKRSVSIEVEGLDQISLDNRENIFYADKGGNVVKLNKLGIVTNQYSPPLQSKLSQLEAYWTVNIFMFSADLQQFILLDVFLNPISTFSIQNENINIVKAATLGTNTILWLFDEVDLSLIQYDFKRNIVLQDQPLSLVLGVEKMEVLEILERHNLIFMNIKNQGVFIFDNHGNFLKKLEHHFTQKLNLFNESIFYIQEGLIHQVQIYSGKKNIYRSPDFSYNKIVVSENKVIFYSSTFIHIYAQPGFE